jgi:putative transposase
MLLPEGFTLLPVPPTDHRPRRLAAQRAEDGPHRHPRARLVHGHGAPRAGINDGQRSLPFRGGPRRGAGRPKSGRGRVPHRARPLHRKHDPILITLRALDDLVSLRRPRIFVALRRAFALAARRAGFRVTSFSVQTNHAHTITEADSDHALRRGARGLAIRLARAFNRVTGRTGRVWADRYHARELRSPRQVRNALVYVLSNWKKHRRGATGIDPFSSAIHFDGWEPSEFTSFARWQACVEAGLDPPYEAAAPVEAGGPLDDPERCPVVRPHCWLLATGWRRRGLIGTQEHPAPHG